MTRYGIPIVILLLSWGVANGQQTKPWTAQSTAIPQATSSRSSYDPMARGKGTSQPKGLVETTLAGVNPQNKDYGAVVGDWRKEVFENTIGRIYFWSLVVLSLGLGCSLMGNGWFLRERERRLSISADIVAQLYNAYVGSRAKALEAISKHNTLVERYNHLDSEAANLRNRISTECAERSVTTTSDFDEARQQKPEEASPTKDEHTDSRVAPREDEHASVDRRNLVEKLQELEVKLQRKEAQLQAKENQISNLRGRLSRAHDTLEGQRQPNSGTK